MVNETLTPIISHHIVSFSPTTSALTSAAALVVFVLSYSLGFGPIPFIMLAEAPGGDGLGGFLTASAMAANFAAVKIFPYSLSGLGLPATFALSSLVCAGGALFALALIFPKTSADESGQVEEGQSVWL